VEIDDLADDPIVQLGSWLRDAEAAGIPFPHTMTVATASADARPLCTHVLLRGIDHRGLVFCTNTESRKASKLNANPVAALILFWQALTRQVQIEGDVTRSSSEEAAAYFA
jgi:pyridoxamine 5'-phosphate oxidase